MSSFDTAVGRRPARSTGAPDTLTHSPRMSPEMARARSRDRNRGPSYTWQTAAQRKAAAQRGAPRGGGRKHKI